MSRIDVIPEPPPGQSEKTTRKSEETVPAAPEDIPHSEENTDSKLASMIASMSGLDKREVIRRAQRKRRALGPVSLEVAMLLLAREQNLEMEKLVEIP